MSDLAERQILYDFRNTSLLWSQRLNLLRRHLTTGHVLQHVMQRLLGALLCMRPNPADRCLIGGKGSKRLVYPDVPGILPIRFYCSPADYWR